MEEGLGDRINAKSTDTFVCIHKVFLMIFWTANSIIVDCIIVALSSFEANDITY